MDSTNTPQRALIKLLSIVGLFAILILFIWLIVQGLRVFPSAFSSLASIAETINNYRPGRQLEIVLEKNVVNSGEQFTISWTDMGAGTYTFHYTCVDDVYVSVRTAEGTRQDVACTQDLILPEGTTGLFLSVETKTQQFSEVPFTLTFAPKRGDAQVTEGSVSVVNAAAPQVAQEDEPEVEIPTPVVVTPEPTPTTLQPAPTPAAPTQPATTLIALYPQSLPNGNVDLKISYLGVGTISNGAFVSKATFDEDDRAAFRFEVKNIGSKSSDSWTYELKLPGNVSYESVKQASLLPNERAIFTVGFDLIESRDRSVTVEGEVKTSGDTYRNNNSFEWSVKTTN